MTTEGKRDEFLERYASNELRAKMQKDLDEIIATSRALSTPPPIIGSAEEVVKQAADVDQWRVRGTDSEAMLERLERFISERDPALWRAFVASEKRTGRTSRAKTARSTGEALKSSTSRGPRSPRS